MFVVVFFWGGAANIDYKHIILLTVESDVDLTVSWLLRYSPCMEEYLMDDQPVSINCLTCEREQDNFYMNPSVLSCPAVL